MSFHLECEGSFSSDNATEEDVNRAFDDDLLRGEYVILTAPNGDFMQAAGDDDGPYVLEHRTVETGVHIQSVGEYTKEEIRNAFLAFLRGDESWREGFEWQPLQDLSDNGSKTSPSMVIEIFLAHKRIYAVIGGIIAGIVIAVILGAWLWLTFWP